MMVRTPAVVGSFNASVAASAMASRSWNPRIGGGGAGRAQGDVLVAEGEAEFGGIDGAENGVDLRHGGSLRPKTRFTGMGRINRIQTRWMISTLPQCFCRCSATSRRWHRSGVGSLHSRQLSAIISRGMEAWMRRRSICRVNIGTYWSQVTRLRGKRRAVRRRGPTWAGGCSPCRRARGGTREVLLLGESGEAGGIAAADVDHALRPRVSEETKELGGVFASESDGIELCR